MIEAKDVLGGRVRPVLKRGDPTLDFADDIALDLGAQFPFTPYSEFETFVLYSDPPYNFEKAPDFVGDEYFCPGDNEPCERTERNVEFGDNRFLGNSYFGFLDTYVIPKIPTQNIVTNSIVTKIDYSNANHITLDITNEQDGTTSTMDCSILLLATGPTVLQPGNPDAIVFEPLLADDYPKHLKALENIELSKGLRAFFEFSTNDFYRDKDIIYTEEEYEFTNIVLGQPSSRHILSLEQIDNGENEPFVGMSHEDIKNELLAALDRAFPDDENGQVPSTKLVDWQVQNWSQERFIRGTRNGHAFLFFVSRYCGIFVCLFHSFTTTFASSFTTGTIGNPIKDEDRIFAPLRDPIQDRIYFCGDILMGETARSGLDMATDILDYIDTLPVPAPTETPTVSPTRVPTGVPTTRPTSTPTQEGQTRQPTVVPSLRPTSEPTSTPTLTPITELPDSQVCIVGAGVSGLLAAYKFSHAGYTNFKVRCTVVSLLLLVVDVWTLLLSHHNLSHPQQHSVTGRSSLKPKMCWEAACDRYWSVAIPTICLGGFAWISAPNSRLLRIPPLKSFSCTMIPSTTWYRHPKSAMNTGVPWKMERVTWKEPTVCLTTIGSWTIPIMATWKRTSSQNCIQQHFEE